MTDTTTRLGALPPDPRHHAPQPTPASLRFTAAIAYLGDPWRGANYPAPLLRDCEEHWRQWSAREARKAPLTTVSYYAVAAYCLGRRDGALAEAGDDDGPARGLAMALSWSGGFLCCLALVAIGYLLSH